MSSQMTRGEREDLQRLIRQREKALKSAARSRSADLLADFESQMAAEYTFDDDEVWAAQAKIAKAEIAKAARAIAERSEELGIPKRFAPSVSINWNQRGENQSKARRAELRCVAEAQVEALERRAVVQIELASVNAQTKLAGAGLSSQAAQEFVAGLPGIDSLMPALSYSEIAGESDPPISKQLITPNALRRRRQRERLKALLSDDVTLPAGDDRAAEAIRAARALLAQSAGEDGA